MSALRSRNWIIGTVVLGSLAIILLGAYLWLFVPANYRGSQYLFTVPVGYSITQTIDQLQRQGFIRSRLGARIAFWASRVTVIKAGTYNVSPRMDVWQIAQIIGSNDSAVANVTIPEGYTVAQIGNLLEQKSLVSGAAFLQAVKAWPDAPAYLQSRTKKDSLEGYLFPDTYSVSRGTPAQDIVQMLLSNFQQRLAPLQTEFAKSAYSFDQVIILASLVEKEARTETNRKLVAQVLLNRLKKNMRLDVDATVRYITGNWTDPITQTDLNSSSPYNTRKFTGLPPTAICNPGVMSIEAVLFPTPTEALYYLVDKDGVMHYAKTLDEHNQNKAKYL